MSAQPQPTGAIIDAYFTLREARRELEAKSKELKDQMDAIEATLLERFDKEEMTLGRGKLASASVTYQTQPNITDWEAFTEYLLKNEAVYLLQRRVAAAAYRELLEAGEEVPGVVPFTQRSISLRKL